MTRELAVRDTSQPYYLHGYEIWQGPKTGSWRVRRCGDKYLTWGFDREEQAREFATRIDDRMDAAALRALYAEVRGEPVGT